MALPSTIQDRDFNNFADNGDGTSSRFVTMTGAPGTNNNILVTATGTTTAIANSIVVQTVLAANTNRDGFFLYNDSNKDCFIKFGATATTSLFGFRLTPGDFFDGKNLPNYLGIITCIWPSPATGSLMATEFTG